MKADDCPECGNAMRLSCGPGRLRRYRRDNGFEIPSDMVFRACHHCGAEWMTDTQIDRLSVAFEAERARRLSNDVSRTRAGVINAQTTPILITSRHPIAVVGDMSTTPLTLEIA